jgi:hypothetical protein
MKTIPHVMSARQRATIGGMMAATKTGALLQRRDEIKQLQSR